MATRFYFHPSSNAQWTTSLAPAFDSGWEQTGEAHTRRMVRKDLVETFVGSSTTFVTIPITTTQDILQAQLVSDPIPAQRLIGTFSFINKWIENASTNNATLAIVVKVIKDDLTLRGTLFSNFNQDTEFDLGTHATRIVNAQAITATTTLPGDRLVVEYGVHAAGPTAAGNAQESVGHVVGSADFALTSGLTTVLFPWLEFSQNLFDSTLKVNRGLRPRPFAPGLAR